MRLDQYLVKNSLTSTRGQAKALIEKGDVSVNGIVQSKTSSNIKDNDKVDVASKMYVSRGAFKLIKALKHYKLDVSGLVAADIGASTGGFTEVLIENNIDKVYCVDVGHGQLSPKLVSNNKVINLEKINARDPLPIKEKVDLFVCDVSFISLKLIFKNMSDILKKGGHGVILIKPQFEAGKGEVSKGGVVRDKSIHRRVIRSVAKFASDLGFTVNGITVSPIKGLKEGNSEFLLWLHYGEQDRATIDLETAI